MDQYKINHFSYEPRAARRRVRITLVSMLGAVVMLALAIQLAQVL